LTSARAALLRARTLQPFNAIATHAVRAACRKLDIQWEWAVRHLHHIGLVRSRLPNGRDLVLWSRADDWVSNQVFWRGWQGYEPETAPLFFKLASRARVTLDVGAYVGYYTLLAAHANPSGRVLAFEPLPANLERLRSNVKRNNTPNVECIGTAVGDAEGTQEFFHSPSGLPCSSSLSQGFMAHVPGLTSMKVSVVTIDAICSARALEVDLIKIDTETTEPAVLRGAADTLARLRPDIICEVLAGRDTGPAVQAALGPLGYDYFLLTPEGPRRMDRIAGHPEWLNYLITARGSEAVGTCTNRTLNAVT
jgi:FkbM family methyltransferase